MKKLFKKKVIHNVDNKLKRKKRNGHVKIMRRQHSVNNKNTVRLGTWSKPVSHSKTSFSRTFSVILKIVKLVAEYPYRRKGRER